MLAGRRGLDTELPRERAGNRFQQPGIPISNENSHTDRLCARARKFDRQVVPSIDDTVGFIPAASMLNVSLFSHIEIPHRLK